jgi:hypothetical protein
LDQTTSRLTKEGRTPIRPVHAKPIKRAPPSPIGTPWAQGGADSDPPCPCEANEKRSAITHWRFMDIGGSESAAPCQANEKRSAIHSLALHRHKEGRTPIRPVHAKPMKSAPQSPIGTPWASADRSPPLRAISIGSQNFRLGDFERWGWEGPDILGRAWSVRVWAWQDVRERVRNLIKTVQTGSEIQWE